MVLLATATARKLSLSVCGKRATLPVNTSFRQVHVEKHIEALGIKLPPPSSPRANYNIVCHAAGNMMYVSGHLPFKHDGTLMTGRIGEDGRDKDYGYEAARNAGLNIISTLKEQLGDLDRVEQVVKVSIRCCRLCWRSVFAKVAATVVPLPGIRYRAVNH